MKSNHNTSGKLHTKMSFKKQLCFFGKCSIQTATKNAPILRNLSKSIFDFNLATVNVTAVRHSRSKPSKSKKSNKKCKEILKISVEKVIFDGHLDVACVADGQPVEKVHEDHHDEKDVHQEVAVRHHAQIRITAMKNKVIDIELTCEMLADFP